MKQLTLNKDVIRMSIITAMRQHHQDAKEAMRKSLQLIVIDKDGEFCFIDGYERCLKSYAEHYNEIAKLKAELNQLESSDYANILMPVV